MPIQATATRTRRRGDPATLERHATRRDSPRRHATRRASIEPAHPVRERAPELAPNTLPHFERWCARRLVLDNGEPFVVEPFQLAALADYFDGCRETLVLLPSGNGKTTLFAALALYHLIFWPDGDAECFIAAAARDQASYMYRHAKGFVSRSPYLKRRVKVLKGHRKIESRTDEGYIQVLASDADTVDGVGPTLALVDELHRHRDDSLYVVLQKGLKKRHGQLITCSTAGDDEDSALGRLRKRGLKLPTLRREGKHRFGRSRNGAFAFHEWALDPADDRDDIALVKQANPLSTITVEDLLVEHDSMTPWNWARFACGVWVGGQHQAVDPLRWAMLGRPGLTIPAGVAISLGIDLGWRVDSTAIVPLWMRAGDDRRFGIPTILHPPREGSVQEDDILAAIAEFAAVWKVERIVFDPNAGGHQLAQKLRKLGYTTIEWLQDPAPMSLAAERFDTAIREGLVAHPEDEQFTAQVLASVAESTSGEKWRYGKPKRKRRGTDVPKLNDAHIAAVMVHAAEVAELEEPEIDPDLYRMET